MPVVGFVGRICVDVSHFAVGEAVEARPGADRGVHAGEVEAPVPISGRGPFDGAGQGWIRGRGRRCRRDLGGGQGRAEPWLRLVDPHGHRREGDREQSSVHGGPPGGWKVPLTYQATRFSRAGASDASPRRRGWRSDPRAANAPSVDRTAGRGAAAHSGRDRRCMSRSPGAAASACRGRCWRRPPAPRRAPSRRPPTPRYRQVDQARAPCGRRDHRTDRRPRAGRHR